MLEFVGLAVSPGDSSKIAQRASKRRADDWGIEHFSSPSGPLSLVTPAQAISKYKGSYVEAESALAAVLHVANKALAHITSTHDGAIDIRLLEIASRGVPAIVTSYFYTPLGLPVPRISITGRRRNDG